MKIAIFADEITNPTDMAHTKNEIECYRNAVIEELTKMGREDNTLDVATEIDVMRQRSDDAIENYMDFNSPRECAAMFVM